MARIKHPRFSATLALATAMAEAGGERQNRMAAAVAEFAVDTATAWAVDLAEGSIRFTLPDHDLVGSASLVGVFSKVGKTWTWGWSVEGFPAEVTAASARVKSLGFDALEAPIVVLNDAQADGLAQLAFVQSDGVFLYRAFGPAADTYVSVGDLRVEPR